MNSRHRTLAIAAALTLLSAAAHAQMSLPNIFSDHAVLQRDRPIHVWGWDEPKHAVTISLHGQNATATADEFGHWEAWLKPETAGGPFEMTVTGSSVQTVHDLLIGDVWLASGQSNMEMPLKGFGGSEVLHGQETAAAAKPGTIRLLRIEHKTASIPQSDIKATWTQTTPETAADFSAVAYFFGKELNEHEHVPIGLIDSTWGGTSIEAWMSLEGIAQDSALMPLFASRAAYANGQVNAEHMIAEEARQDAEAAKANRPAPAHPRHGSPDSWIPAALYDGMIAPEVGYAMKGVIWYQGESSADLERGPLYAKLMPALIADWRARWKQGDFPFLFVQISSWKPGTNWGIVRDAQRKSLSTINTGMAVTTDIGHETNIHPPDKPTVGARLALAARAIAYNESIEFTGPLYRQTTSEGDSLRVWFDHAAGLQMHGSELAGFEIAGADGVFSPATAKIEGETVIVSSAQIKQPKHVRYGWAGFTTANLYNKADLPASTFASE
jgi:sialate O-acetylesterase